MTTRWVTVFGGTGFLGRRIVHRLVGAGCAVRVAARHIDPRSAGGTEAVVADIADPDAVARALAGVDAVVNAVSLYAEHGGRTFAGVHIEAAGALARAAHRAGTRRLVHVSGIGADPASPSRYVAARARGEAAVRAAFPAAVILRPGVLFGAGDAFLSTLDALTRLPLVPLFGRGQTRLQPVHVDDVAAAAARALELAELPARTLELGGPEVLTYRRVLELVLAGNGRRRPLVPVPFAAWHALAALCRALPRPPLTRDQVVLMQHDNVVGAGMPGLPELGIEPRSLSSWLTGGRPARGQVDR